MLVRLLTAGLVATVASACSFEGVLGTYGADAALHDAGVAVDASLEPDADPDADVVEVAPCGTISLLRDGFTDTAAAPYFYRWSDPGVTVVETGGRLAIQLAAGSADAYGGYDSVFTYDMTGGELAATVSQVGGDYTTLELQDPQNRRIQMLVANRNTLIAKILDVPDPDPEVAIPYDPVAHRHWRMREAGGTLHWETSPDRLAWTELHSAPVPYPLDHVRGLVVAGGQVSGVATEARFEDVGPEPAVDQTFCPISTLVDGFAATPLPPTWDGWSDGDCTTTEASGQVTLSFTGVGESWCGIDSRHLFDLRGSAMYADTAVVTAASFVTFFQAVAPGNGETRLEVDHEDGRLWFYQRINGSNVNSASLLYDAVAHRYWRITEDAGTIYWQTSPDAVTWVTRHQAAAGFDVSAVHVVAGAGSYGSGPGSPVVINYRGVNLP